MSALTFRDAGATDVPRIVALIESGVADPEAHVTADPDDPRFLAAFERIRAAPNQRLIVAERGGEVVGTFQISYQPGLARLGMTRAIVESVHVAAAHRGQGIGAQMMTRAIAMAREAGCGVVQLTSNKKRLDAHRFYKRLGFEASHEGFRLML